MANLRKLCEEYFGSKDFYDILNIDKTASQQEIKKAYYKLSLSVHPDRVEESEKAYATEKFKILGKIHSILQDKEKRKVYDDTGDFDEESDDFCNWLNYWKSMFKTITVDDIKNYEKSYIGSETEIRDIKKAYVSIVGCSDRGPSL
ncbi:J domain-containing protein CG6693-like [Agrilus planipennis]|uniref:J domain-containing protein CG6693-like n=1 Tax=Agrilus planipennis TaxID=224129 RepID=A0A7F5QXE0_AGRPL|nr:J domain-containing protein CG6693-like [Agrilus planipennis]